MALCARRSCAATAIAIAAVLVAFPHLQVVVDATTFELYDYVYDGDTTYCYWLDQGMSVENLDFTYVHAEGKDLECPLTLSLTQATTGDIVPKQDVEYAFTATLNLNDNNFDMDSLQATVQTSKTSYPVQIGHANIHTCSSTSVCDIFRTGSNRKITNQETSNFTDDSASFRQRIAFNAAGEFNVFAHIILPPTNPANSSYHFMAFLTTTVISEDSSDSSSGLSSGATIGLICGSVAFVIVVILAVVFCKGKKRDPMDTDHFRNSGFTTTHTAKNAKLDWTSDTTDPSWKDHHYPPPPSSSSQHMSDYRYHSEYRQGPALTASALSFHERVSKRVPQKTASSSGSFTQQSPKASDFFGDHHHPAASGGVGSPATILMQRSYQNENNHVPANISKGSSVHNGGNMMMKPNDDYMGYDNHYPEVEPFTMPASYESETSMGTSIDYNSGTHFLQKPFNPLHQNTFERASDMSSINDYDTYGRGRGDTDESMRPLDESRISDASVGTVDFTVQRPAPLQSPRFRGVDESFGYSSSDFQSTNRSTGTFRVDEDKSFRPSDTFRISSADQVHDDARERRTLSDGEHYEF